MEKNWLLFFTPDSGTYTQYEVPPEKRTFAKLIGNGYVTPNLTSPVERQCLGHPFPLLSDIYASGGYRKDEKDGWHQATNSLRVLLCNRRDTICQADEAMAVFVAVIQRKIHDSIGLVSRYEPVVVIWEGRQPFHMLAVGKARMKFSWEESLMGKEAKIRNGQSAVRDGPTPTLATSSSMSKPPPIASSPPSSLLSKKRGYHTKFTFILSIAFDHSRRRKEEQDSTGGATPETMYTGYLDDYVIAGIGIGDRGMGVVRMRVRELVSGIAICPGALGE